VASAADTYDWATYGDEIKAYCGVSDSSEDTLLEAWLSSAAQDCDDYVGHDWTDDDGNDETHPPQVLLGIKEWVRVYRLAYRRDAGIGLFSKKTGPFAEVYARSTTSSTPAALARAAAVQLWQASVYDMAGLGSGY